MTGREFCEWVRENGAEDLEMVIVDEAEIVWEVKPTIEDGEEVCCGCPDGDGLDDGTRYIVL